jgi:hypothetical protein
MRWRLCSVDDRQGNGVFFSAFARALVIQLFCAPLRGAWPSGRAFGLSIAFRIIVHLGLSRIRYIYIYIIDLDIKKSTTVSGTDKLLSLKWTSMAAFYRLLSCTCGSSSPDSSDFRLLFFTDLQKAVEKLEVNIGPGLLQYMTNFWTVLSQILLCAFWAFCTSGNHFGFFPEMATICIFLHFNMAWQYNCREFSLSLPSYK